MAETVLRDDVAVGLLKFKENISPQDLISFAGELRDAPSGGLYQELSVRAIDDKPARYGICFRFWLGGNDKELYDRFFYRLTDKLKRRFGNDLVGWDIGRRVWDIT